jgi:hypothetical protein
VTRPTRVVIGIALALAFVVPASASASDASLKSTLGTWSHRIGLDARGIGASAVNKHPKRMTSRAKVFRADALKALKALSAAKPSSAKGTRAKNLALTAFRDYAVVGREWMLAGQARVAHHNSVSGKYAKLAARYAMLGNTALVAAGKLLG